MSFLNINDYRYDLPQERIALYPLSGRDESKLLVYKNRAISHARFTELADFLPDNAFLFFNDTKVIPARMHFKKGTGADIEIFLLTPVEPSPVLSLTMQSYSSCKWICTIGNLKRWTEGLALSKPVGHDVLEARLADRGARLVEFSWKSERTFAEIIRESGETPLPPYLKRKPEKADHERYQTIYSHFEGAVAAPTAGLHFTNRVFESLAKKGIGHNFVTLHVSAGTFQPVKTENVNKHIMHSEQIVISLENLDNILKQGRLIIPVGTTSMRTLESIYWFGAKLLKNKKAAFRIHQNDPYENTGIHPSPYAAIEGVRQYMIESKQETLIGESAVFIKPGYEFKICKGLVTNFHQPGSTLMLLVAAFVGDDWKRIYAAALNNNYRFLSFGDSSLLFQRI